VTAPAQPSGGALVPNIHRRMADTATEEEIWNASVARKLAWGDGDCVDNIAITGSNWWLSWCSWDDPNSHTCFLPFANSGARERFCCCYPFMHWDLETSACIADPTHPVEQAVIPGSEQWWHCTSADHYQCAPPGTQPYLLFGGNSTLGAAAAGGAHVIGWICLVFCCMCMCCGGSHEAAKEREYQQHNETAANQCRTNEHELVEMTCAEMGRQDSDYREAWICDSCNCRNAPGQNEPFQRCQECRLDFCESCAQHSGHRGGFLRRAATQTLGGGNNVAPGAGDGLHEGQPMGRE